jgi:hypothetical protein
MNGKKKGGISKLEVEVDGLSGKGGEEGKKECVCVCVFSTYQ